ncbi:MAG TPA: fibronectin type III domain-containing protein, partial [Actinomycetes bacterium]|nr:fibronectin type III domain-containing protein [Actinomycetes bacterium]
MRRTVRNVVLAALAAGSLLVPGGLAYAAPPSSAPPTGLRATAVTTSTVSLAWNPASGATSYQVLRGAPGGALSVVGSTGSTTYVDSGRTAGTTYAYAVAAVRKTKVSAPSSSIDVTTVPPAPTGLTAEARSTTEVAVVWSTTPGASSYDVYRSTGGAAAVKVFTYVAPVGGGQVPAPGWTDTTVSP